MNAASLTGEGGEHQLNIQDFIDTYPELYHMATADAWPTIKKHGLLSTQAVLDRACIAGAARYQLESRQRKECVRLEIDGIGSVEIRDQKVMPESKLSRCLKGCTPSSWYKIINSKVYFWATWARVEKLLTARPYRNKPQLCVSIDTGSLVKTHLTNITLCHRNSGQTIYIHPDSLGRHIFHSISSYPVTRTGRARREAAEVAVNYAVPDLKRHVKEVQLLENGVCIKTIFSR